MTILEEWGITAEQLSKILQDNPSLRGMLFGYVAEIKLREMIGVFPNVSYMTKFDDHDRTKKGDLYVIYQGKAFDIESKSLQTATVARDETNQRWIAKAQVDASDKRTIRLPDETTMNTTLLLRGEFDILAVNCYAFENKWNFVFAENSELPTSTFPKYTQVQKENLIASLILVTWPPEPPFYANLQELLDKMIQEGRGKNPRDIAADAEKVITEQEDSTVNKKGKAKQTKLF
jgi:hypothetical protein